VQKPQIVTGQARKAFLVVLTVLLCLKKCQMPIVGTSGKAEERKVW